MSIKANNENMGPNGLVPSPLVFGALPRFLCIKILTLSNENDFKILN